MVNEMHNQSSSPPVALEPRYITRAPNEEIMLYEGLIHIQSAEPPTECSPNHGISNRSAMASTSARIIVS